MRSAVYDCHDFPNIKYECVTIILEGQFIVSDAKTMEYGYRFTDK